MTCPWMTHVAHLVQWAFGLITRRDVHGKYIPTDRRTDPKKIAFTEKAEPTADVLEAHFAGRSVIGLFVLDVDGSCRVVIVDIDRHGEEGDAEANERAAITLFDRAVGQGFSAFLEDSNGRGGYKLWLIFEEPVSARWVRRLARRLVQDWRELGLAAEPEIFPKQDTLDPGKFGNFVRLPGRHHTLNFWSRIWSGANWLEGEDAARRILATVGSSVGVIPEEFLVEAENPGRLAPRTSRGVRPSPGQVRLIRCAIAAFPGGFPGNYDDWLKVGMSLLDLGEEGLELWDEISRKCPNFRDGACREKWQTFRPDGGLNWPTILHIAKQHGWSRSNHRERIVAKDIVGEPARANGHQAAASVDVETLPWPPAPVARELPAPQPATAGTFAESRAVEGDVNEGAGEGDAEASPKIEAKGRPLTDRQREDEECRADPTAPGKGQQFAKKDELVLVALKPAGLEFEYADSGLYRLTTTKDGDHRTALTNFGARIVAELTVTDGDRSHKEFRIEAVVEGVARRVDIRAEEFEPMRWPAVFFGGKAIVKAGQITRDRAREAIQAVSTRMEQVTVYQHTGFINEGGEYYYLHAGGAIGAVPGPIGAGIATDRPHPNAKDDKELGWIGPIGMVNAGLIGPKNIEVRFPSAIAGYRLPEPPTGEDLIHAITASLKLLEFPDDLVSFPLYALTWVGPLGIGNFTVHMDGGTGKNKSVRAGLIQQHYGAGMNWEHLPCSWSSTPIALEGTTFQCKDALTCIDDWLLQGSRSDHEQAQRSAAHMIRAAANQAGRQRSNRDGTPNVGRPPRGPILTTGEATPDGHSINARLVRLLVSSNLLDPLTKPLLDRCQADADAGLYAQAMAGFVRYVAGRYEQLQRDTAGRVAYFRDQLRTEFHCRHPRTATILAKLMAAFEVFLEYAREAGAIDGDQLTELFDRQGKALIALSRQHGLHLQGNDPWDQFVDLLSGALMSGLAHLENRLGGRPIDENPAMWGWRSETFTVKKEAWDPSRGQPASRSNADESLGDTPDQEDRQSEAYDAGVEYEEKLNWRPQGPRIGWIHMGTIYLLGGPSLAAAQLLANRLGLQLPLSERTLGRAAYDRGKLLDSDIHTSRGKYGHRVSILGKRVEVYSLKASTILPDTSTFGAFEDMIDGEAQKAWEELIDPYEAARRRRAERFEA